MSHSAECPQSAPEGELEALRHRVAELEERILEASCTRRRGEVNPERYVDPVIESEALHRVLLAAMPDPVVTIEDDGEIVSASDSVRAVLGYRPAELLGRHVSLLVPEPTALAMTGIWRPIGRQVKPPSSAPRPRSRPATVTAG